MSAACLLAIAHWWVAATAATTCSLLAMMAGIASWQVHYWERGWVLVWAIFGGFSFIGSMFLLVASGVTSGIGAMLWSFQLVAWCVQLEWITIVHYRRLGYRMMKQKQDNA